MVRKSQIRKLPTVTTNIKYSTVCLKACLALSKNLASSLQKIENHDLDTGTYKNFRGNLKRFIFMQQEQYLLHQLRDPS
jgi:hypothetical protein